MATTRSLFAAVLFFISLFFFSFLSLANGQNLIIDPVRFASSIEVINVVTDRTSQCNVAEGCLPHDTVNLRRVVRADIVIANIADEALELSIASTLLNTTPCDTRTLGMKDILRFQVTDPTEFLPFGTKDRTICLYDGEPSPRYNGTEAPDAAFYTCNTSTPSGFLQGISAGWQVTYSKELDCFAMDITDLDPGEYRFTVTFNNLGQLAETNRSVVTSLFTIPNSECQPVPRYSNETTAFSWDDPIANGHTLVSGFALFQLNLVDELRYFCYRSTSLWLSPRGFVSLINPVNEDTFLNSAGNLFNASMAPYWYQEWETSTDVTGAGMYHNVTGSTGQRTITVSWIGLVAESQVNKSRDNAQSFQLVYSEATQVLVFRYLKVSVEQASFTRGQAQTIAITGPTRLDFASHTLLVADKEANSVADSTAIRFVPQPPGGNGARPAAETTGPYSGFETRPINFNALSSSGGATPVTTYTWLFGDGQYPARVLDGNVNYTYPIRGSYTAQVKVSNGADESDVTTVAVTVNLLPGDGGPITPSDGEGDGETVAIVAGVVIPVLVIIAILVCIAAAFLVYYNRGIVPSGGAWWNEDPEYVNLPHTWNGAEEAGPSTNGK